jgi:hypothetical protein
MSDEEKMWLGVNRTLALMKNYMADVIHMRHEARMEELAFQRNSTLFVVDRACNEAFVAVLLLVVVYMFGGFMKEQAK